MFQKDCLDFDCRLKDFLVPVKKAHITLLVLHISEERMEEAKGIFKSVINETISNTFDEDIFEVKFEGVGSFNNMVVFAYPLTGVDRMQYMNQELFKAFSEKGFSCDSKFTPHLTLMKKGYKKSSNLNKIPSQSFENAEEKQFGTQQFSGIQLLSMTKPQTKDGYYYCEEEFKFRRRTSAETEQIVSLERRKENIRRTTRDSVTSALKSKLSGTVGILVAGIVAGASVIWEPKRRIIQ